MTFEQEKALMPAVETLLDTIHATGAMGAGSPAMNKATDALLDWIGAVGREEKARQGDLLGP